MNMKEIIPKTFALIFVLSIPAVVFYAIVREGDKKKQKEIEKERIERESFYISKPDANF